MNKLRGEILKQGTCVCVCFSIVFNFSVYLHAENTKQNAQNRFFIYGQRTRTPDRIQQKKQSSILSYLGKILQ